MSNYQTITNNYHMLINVNMIIESCKVEKKHVKNIL